MAQTSVGILANISPFCQSGTGSGSTMCVRQYLASNQSTSFPYQPSPTPICWEIRAIVAVGRRAVYSRNPHIASTEMGLKKDEPNEINQNKFTLVHPGTYTLVFFFLRIPLCDCLVHGWTMDLIWHQVLLSHIQLPSTSLMRSRRTTIRTPFSLRNNFFFSNAFAINSFSRRFASSSLASCSL